MPKYTITQKIRLFTAVVCVVSVCFLLYALRVALNPPLFSQPENVSKTSTPASPRPIMVYGYLPYWTRSTASFPRTLTHVSYFSLSIQSDGKIIDIPRKDQDAGYRAYNAGVLDALRKELSPEQQLELTITLMNQETIPLFLLNSQAQDQFLFDLEKIVLQAPISGVNIDIEYNGLLDEKLQESFVALIRSSSILLRQHGKNLSVASYADAGSIRRLTDLEKIEPYVDWVVMMAYDYHQRPSPRAGPNSPLYGKTQGAWESDILTDLAGYTRSIPAHKILLGIPFYGYQWQIEDANNPNSFTIPRSGASVTYEHIVPLLEKEGVRRFLDHRALSPYLRFEKNGKPYVLYYDDPESLAYKLELVRQAGLGGVAIWAVGYEGKTTELWKTIGP